MNLSSSRDKVSSFFFTIFLFKTHICFRHVINHISSYSNDLAKMLIFNFFLFWSRYGAKQYPVVRLQFCNSEECKVTSLLISLARYPQKCPLGIVLNYILQ